MINKKTISRFIIGLILAVIAFIWMIPFIWTLLTSLKDDSEIYTNVLNSCRHISTQDITARSSQNSATFLPTLRTL